MNEWGVHTDSRIEHEDGRYVVYLDVLMVDRSGMPSSVAEKRITDYATQRKAEIAASWMLRAARRSSRCPVVWSGGPCPRGG
ncbi:MAG: hypothetical protein AAF957_13900 [Planctomycetota bacterium]